MFLVKVWLVTMGVCYFLASALVRNEGGSSLEATCLALLGAFVFQYRKVIGRGASEAAIHLDWCFSVLKSKQVDNEFLPLTQMAPPKTHTDTHCVCARAPVCVLCSYVGRGSKTSL